MVWCSVVGPVLCGVGTVGVWWWCTCVLACVTVREPCSVDGGGGGRARTGVIYDRSKVREPGLILVHIDLVKSGLITSE